MDGSKYTTFDLCSTAKTIYGKRGDIFGFYPVQEVVGNGIWTFIIAPISENQHDYHMFLPNSNARNFGTRFLRPTPELTMTIPAFARRALTVEPMILQ